MLEIAASISCLRAGFVRTAETEDLPVFIVFLSNSGGVALMMMTR
jgi:hypothetical protein